jgi:hypothetical protein
MSATNINTDSGSEIKLLKKQLERANKTIEKLKKQKRKTTVAKPSSNLQAFNGKDQQLNINPTSANSHNFDAFKIFGNNKFIETLDKLKNKLPVKVSMNLCIRMEQEDLATNSFSKMDTFWFNSKAQAVYHLSEAQDIFGMKMQELSMKIESFVKNGSSWKFNSVVTLILKVSSFKPLAGSSYIDLPDYIKNKKACVNVKNKDNKCFMWSVLSALHTPSKNADRVTKYQDYENELMFDGINFPVQIKDIAKFETMNNLGILVIGYDNKSGFSPLKTPTIKMKKNINLLLIEDGENFHYVWIKDLSRLLHDINLNGSKKYFCVYCFSHFMSQQALDKHAEDCVINKPTRAVLPEAGTKLQFQNNRNETMIPFIIYADFESVLEPTNEHKSNTTCYQIHKPCSYAYKLVCSKNPKLSKPVQMKCADNDNDITECFLNDMHKELKYINEYVKDKKGKVPIVFHNFKGYDSHLLIRSIGKFKGRLSCIASNQEKLITLGINRLQFIDSLAFLNSSLEKLANNLDTEDFVYTKEHFPDESKFELVKQKGVFPYDWFDHTSKLNNKKLPPKDEFYSSLNSSHISDNDYEHAQLV